MADNTVLNQNTTVGDAIRDKDRSGVKTQIVALDLNPAGSETLMAGAMPVTGTFWQSTQPISGTVTANAGTGTMAVSAASLPLPSGASTAAKQPALGTAGTAATDVLTIQGIASMTALKVDGSAVTQPVSLAANVTVVGTGTFAVQSALQAGTNLIGQTSASHETGTIYSGTTALTPKFATISASASGATTVVAAVGGKRIRVLRWSLSSNGAVNVKWQSHVGPTDLTGLHYLTQFASAGGAYCPVGIFQTVSGEALDINLSAAVPVGGELTYVEV